MFTNLNKDKVLSKFGISLKPSKQREVKKPDSFKSLNVKEKSVTVINHNAQATENVVTQVKPVSPKADHSKKVTAENTASYSNRELVSSRPAKKPENESITKTEVKTKSEVTDRKQNENKHPSKGEDKKLMNDASKKLSISGDKTLNVNDSVSRTFQEKINTGASENTDNQNVKGVGKTANSADKITPPEKSPRTDDSNNLPNEAVQLEPDADPPFERRNVIPRKDCTIDAEYTIVDFLGRGKFGEVKKCIEKKSRKEFAVKLVPVRTETERREVFNEIEVMNSLQHPRLLQLYDAFDGKKEIALVMELINGGELFERVIDEDFILTERLCELYVEQICEGIAFMHKENFLHLDMKPENILCINRNGHRIKIIDFGLARKFRPGDTLKILFGTPEFVAPEVISYEKIGRGTDMWSIGVICYVLLSGLSPFMGENDVETYNNISRVEYDFEDEAFEEISTEAKDFISKLLVLKKEKRMTADECLRHPWLTRHKNVDKSGDEIQINTKKLRRFVIRRRWQKAVNALLALKRMGMTL